MVISFTLAAEHCSGRGSHCGARARNEVWCWRFSQGTPPSSTVIHKGIPFVAGTQTINALAFVFDGINFRASDYTYSAYSMVGVAAISIPCLVYLSAHKGFIGIWIAFTIYMSLRTIASTWRMGVARGPWVFLRK